MISNIKVLELYMLMDSATFAGTTVTEYQPGMVLVGAFPELFHTMAVNLINTSPALTLHLVCSCPRSHLSRVAI